jgi:hypothetical protein
MAVETKQDRPVVQHAAGRRVMFGTNVIVVTLLVIGIVFVLQLIGYSASARWDMTASGVNSLSDGTENLLGGLDTNVRLTSLYFETDREDEDQSRYRRAIDDLLGLYEATNRARVVSEWTNPLKDHEKLKNLLARLREKGEFKKEIGEYKARLDAYTNESDGLDREMNALVNSELEQIASLGGLMGADTGQEAVARVEDVLRRWTDELATTRETVNALEFLADPQYGAAVDELKRVYRMFSKTLGDIKQYGIVQAGALSGKAADYLAGAGERHAALTAKLEKEQAALQELEPLKLDELLRELAPTGNAILVETDEDAMVVDFSAVWPPLDPNMSDPRTRFRNRAFKGEEKVTAAILRATHKQQTAVVFVRYGGQPLLTGGFMPGMPAAPYSAMKKQLEDANFVVEEWDLKTSDTPPTIDPAPTRTLYVVLKPTPPQRGPMGQQSQEPPFSEANKQALLRALGDSGRALFIAGWHPGPFPGMPASYEYNDYLEQTWGIKVDTAKLLLQVASLDVGKFLPRRDSSTLFEAGVTDHPIVKGPQSRLAMPMCAPLELSESPPEGVESTALVVQPQREDVWGVQNIGEYEQQLKQQNHMTRVESDPTGPFTLAAAAEKGDAKVVVVSAAQFAVDAIAFARNLVIAAEGFQTRSRNPGNVALLVNSLHWLNDNTQFMNVGRPIDLAVLEVERPATVRVVQVLAIVVWPLLALGCGGVAWWVRRR